jgi:hypothetical protein
MTTTNHTSPALTDEQIRNIENDQAKMPGVTRENLTARTVRAALIAQHGFCLDEDQCTCAREIGYRVCQPSNRTSLSGEDAANVAIGEREALLADYIELNMSNYGPDDVDRLNAWAIEAYDFISRAALTAEKVAGQEPVTGELQAFEAWFRTSGFWNNAITEKAWRAACTWMRELNATMCEDVMEQSRNSLFRSAAKVCAGLIRSGRKAQCDLPPEGWYCTRDKGHEGPCAAYATEQQPAQSAEQDELLLAAKEVLANGHQHDVGGGDVFVGTCEAAERLQRAVDARAASTSANVAQGAAIQDEQALRARICRALAIKGNLSDDEIVTAAELHHYEFTRLFTAATSRASDLVALMAPPAQTPLTDDARSHWNPIYNTDPVQRACGELPEGWEIEITLEQGAGCVYLIDPTGERTDIDSADKFDWTIHEAIDAALTTSQSASGGKS